MGYKLNGGPNQWGANYIVLGEPPGLRTTGADNSSACSNDLGDRGKEPIWQNGELPL